LALDANQLNRLNAMSMIRLIYAHGCHLNSDCVLSKIEISLHVGTPIEQCRTRIRRHLDAIFISFEKALVSSVNHIVPNYNDDLLNMSSHQMTFNEPVDIKQGFAVHKRPSYQ
jgi:hypothetical protein